MGIVLRKETAGEGTNDKLALKHPKGKKKGVHIIQEVSLEGNKRKVHTPARRNFRKVWGKNKEPHVNGK